MNTIELDGVTLNPNMEWVDRHEAQKVIQTVKQVIGGSPVVYAKAVDKGIYITLEATENYGWNTLSVVQQIEAKADVPGAIYALTLHNQVFNVVFRHDDPPAVQMRPLIHRINEGTGDQFIGTLKFMTV